MGIRGSDRIVRGGDECRARTGPADGTEQLKQKHSSSVAVRSDYVSKAANLVLYLVAEGEETGYDYNHTHECT